MNEKANNITHELKMLDRSLLSLTGVKKIVSFDNEEFILETVFGPIHIKGETLELLSLDLQDNSIRIKGKILGFNYIDKINKKSDEGILAKLFK